MRAKVLMLVLVAAVVWGAGCSVDMSEKGPKGHGATGDWCRESFQPVLAIIGPRGGMSGNETAFALIRHADGTYYVINMNKGIARQVKQIKPCNPCGN